MSTSSPSRKRTRESGDDMAPHADILDDQESLRNPFIGSMLFHAGILALLAYWTTNSTGTRFILGTQMPAFGNAVSVDSVRALPLPHHAGPTNPVANDTENRVPQHAEQKPQPKTRQPE